MACDDLTPWDIVRWRGVKAVWKNQDYEIVGPRIRVPVSFTAAGQATQIAKVGGAIFGDVNCNTFMPSDAKFWLLVRAFKLQVKGNETQVFDPLADALDAATLTHTPLGQAAYVHSLGVDAVGSDFAIPSYGPAAGVGAIGSPVALQPGWRHMPGWLAIDMEFSSLVLTVPASVGLVTTQGFLDVDGWAVKKQDIKDSDVKTGKKALGRYFQDMAQAVQRRLPLTNNQPRR